MKTLSISLALTDEDAALLMTKYSCKELEGVVAREGYHALHALINTIKETIPLVQDEEEKLAHSL